MKIDVVDVLILVRLGLERLLERCAELSVQVLDILVFANFLEELVELHQIAVDDSNKPFRVVLVHQSNLYEFSLLPVYLDHGVYFQQG